MAMKFPVSKEKMDALNERLSKLGISEKDLDERFLRSQGPGGQHTNKVSTCVVLKHLQSGFQVKCQKERSQGLNRYYARKRLAEKLEKHLYGIRLEEEKKRYKIRKQKKRRSRRAKMKIREEKERQSFKKKLRRSIHIEE